VDEGKLVRANVVGVPGRELIEPPQEGAVFADVLRSLTAPIELAPI
jgi:hypothetical protein